MPEQNLFSPEAIQKNYSMIWGRKILPAFVL